MLTMPRLVPNAVKSVRRLRALMKSGYSVCLFSCLSGLFVKCLGSLSFMQVTCLLLLMRQCVILLRLPIARTAFLQIPTVLFAASL